MAIKRLASARPKRKRRRGSRQWNLPDLRNQAVPFAIDDEIGKAKLQSRWLLAEAVAFGRRSLEVAIEDARAYENFNPGENLAYWSNVGKLANRANDALSTLMRGIGPGGLRQSDFFSPFQRVSSSLVKSGKIRVGLLPQGKPVGQFRTDFEALVRAGAMLDNFSIGCRRRREFLARNRRNDGDPAKRAFVFRLAEGWIFLIGKKPGRSYVPERNPFLRFVLAGWRDAGFNDDAEDFSRALDATLSQFENYEGWSWSEQSRQTIQGLSAAGPIWMRR